MSAVTTAHSTPPRGWILPVIVLSQFAGTSLWFAGNAVMTDLQHEWGLPDHALGDLTSAVQLGFISGTLTFAFFSISDRYSPRRVFFVCSLLGAAANLLLYVAVRDFGVLLASRFLTGFFLAGIYPVGMKIAGPGGIGKVWGMQSDGWSAHWCSARLFPTVCAGRVTGCRGKS